MTNASSSTNAAYNVGFLNGTSMLYNSGFNYNPSTAMLTSLNVTAGNTVTAGIVYSRQYQRPILTDTDGATITFDMSASTGTDVHDVTLGGNRTYVFSGTSASQFFTINTKQDSTGSRTVTWPSGITWMNTTGNSAPMLLTMANKIDTTVCRVITAGTTYQCWQGANQ